jgi:DNA-binding NtrC family response regulator
MCHEDGFPVPQNIFSQPREDDEIPIRKLAENMLVRKGYSVMTAGSGEEALEVYREKGAHIDLVVLDLGMPGMGGEKCLEELKKIDPAVRVLVAGGYSGGGQAQKFRDLGVGCYIIKPYRFEALLAAVREALSAGPPPA